MTAARRLLTTLALTAGIVLTAGLPAQALFADRVLLATTTVGTATVAPATDVRVETSCTTRTVETKQTYRTHPGSGTVTLISTTQTTTYATSTTDVDSTTTTTTSGPRTHEHTVTTVDKDTTLYATLRWTSSTAADVTGYRMTAHFAAGQTASMGQTGPAQTSMTGSYDAGVTAWQPRLSIDTLTGYGWTGTSALSNVVTC